jgi:SH3-like domain-containing protein
MRHLITLLAISLTVSAAQAQDDGGTTPSGQEVPRFVSLKFDVANGRSGPSRAHPVAWRYMRAGLPMEVIAETPNWRRVRDPHGEVTWMHRRVLSGRRSVVTIEETVLRARADLDSAQEAIADAGVVLTLERCRAGWCRVEAQGFRGWAQALTLWGVYGDEQDASSSHDTDGSAALSASLPRDTALR